MPIRALKIAVIVMGVLIVLGVTILIGVIAQRLAAGPPPVIGDVLLDEPEGTRIASAAVQSDRVALTLQGGGPDRVVVVDLRSGKIAGRVALRK